MSRVSDLGHFLVVRREKVLEEWLAAIQRIPRRRGSDARITRDRAEGLLNRIVDAFRLSSSTSGGESTPDAWSQSAGTAAEMLDERELLRRTILRVADGEGLQRILAERVAGDLRSPAFEGAAVEQRLPGAGGGFQGLGGGGGGVVTREGEWRAARALDRMCGASPPPACEGRSPSRCTSAFAHATFVRHPGGGRVQTGACRRG